MDAVVIPGIVLANPLEDGPDLVLDPVNHGDVRNLALLNTRKRKYER